MYIKEIQHNNLNYQEAFFKYGSVFNLPKWLEIYSENILVNGIFNSNHELIGAFNLYINKKFGLTYFSTPPYSSNNGFFFINPALNISNKNTFEKDIHFLICDYLKKINFNIIRTAFPVNVIDTQPYFWSNFKVIPNYTYQLMLDKSEEILFENFTTEKRKSIKKATKDLIQVKQEFDYQIVKNLILKTFLRRNKSVDENMINKILFEFADSTNSFTFVAYKNNQPSACTFIIYHNQICYYLLGGYDESNKHHGAGVSCMWQSILYAKKIGIKLFDFEGSMLPEVEKYFREFGGTIVPYYTINKANLLFEIGLKFIKRNTY
jgi:hypothetical protein